MSDTIQKIKDNWPYFLLWGFLPLLLTGLGGLVSLQLYNHIPTQIREVKVDLKADIIREVGRLDADIKMLDADIKELSKELKVEMKSMATENNKNFREILLRLPKGDVASNKGFTLSE